MKTGVFIGQVENLSISVESST